MLDLLPPAGTFSPRSLDGDLLLFAAGSGITPVMSILKSALHAGRGRVVLVYANRDERSVIFGALLRELARGFRRPPGGGALAGFAARRAVRRGDRGPGPAVRSPSPREAFICGPDPYLSLVREALGQLRVPGGRVHVERFLSLAENPFEQTPAAPDDALAATLSVTLDGATTQLPWPAGTRMLDVLIDAGLDAPYSCRQGICGACACQLTGGEVEMAHNEVLEEGDLAEGYILACQALAVTPGVSITY